MEPEEKKGEEKAMNQEQEHLMARLGSVRAEMVEEVNG